jgi:hypothetical protein
MMTNELSLFGHAYKRPVAERPQRHCRPSGRIDQVQPDRRLAA